MRQLLHKRRICFNVSNHALVGYTHGLRVSELIGLQWSDVSFEDATLHIRRTKGGNTGSHPLRADEKRALRALQRQAKGTWVFETERGGPFTAAGFASLIDGQASKPRSVSRCIRTCSGTVQVTRQSMPMSACVICKTFWATSRSTRPRAMLRSPAGGLRHRGEDVATESTTVKRVDGLL